MMSQGSWWTSRRPSHSPTSTPPSAKSSKSTISVQKSPVPPTRSKKINNKYADVDSPDTIVTVTVSPIKQQASSPIRAVSTTVDFDDYNTHNSMSKGRSSRRFAPSSPPNSTTGLTRPATPTSPVQIPRQSTRDSSHSLSRHSSSSHRRKPTKKSHNPASISPSVAALLAVTDIPRLQRQSSKRSHGTDKPLTVNDIINDQQVSEKELSWNLTKSPLDVLLTPPEDLAADDYLSVSGSQVGSTLTSTLSLNSVPSLLSGDSYVTDPILSLESPPYGSITASQRLYQQRRTRSPVRKSLEPVRSPPDSTTDDHPLARTAVITKLPLEDEDIDNAMLSDSSEETTISLLSEQFKPLKAVFKSNLTASFRALRSAAKSFSNINLPSPDDFVTQSMLAMDPKVPYTDERRPPVMKDMPSAEVRRYLNPTTRTRMEELAASSSTTLSSSHSSAATTPASIQMQTYKIQRNKTLSSSARASLPTESLQASSPPPPPARTVVDESAVPGMRQREMRENPDFIRIAVMEMAMRRCGKLDDKRAGRARWALPPRKTSTKVYQVGSDGVPVRWIPTTN